jgi:YD repeat-containing protein
MRRYFLVKLIEKNMYIFLLSFLFPIDLYSQSAIFNLPFKDYTIFKTKDHLQHVTCKDLTLDAPSVGSIKSTTSDFKWIETKAFIINDPPGYAIGEYFKIYKNGNVVEELLQARSTNSDLTPFYIWEYSYDNSGNCYETNGYYWQNSYRIPYSKITRSFNTNNLVQEEINQSMDAQGNWHDYSRLHYNYNESKQLIESILSDAYSSQKTIYKYDLQGNLTEKDTYDDNTEMLIEKWTYLYNSVNNIIESHKFHFYSDGTWSESDRTTYQYSIANLMIEAVRMVQSGNSLINFSMSIVTYNTDGNKSEAINKFWNNGNWYEAYKNTYIYGNDARILQVQIHNGDTLISGSKTNIDWVNYNVDKVNIDLSTDNGKTWNFVAKGIEASLPFLWEVPAIESDSCFIKIYDANNPNIFSQNESRFHIKNTSTNKHNIVLRQLKQGPTITSIDIPQNGTGYLYFDFSSEGKKVFSNEKVSARLIKPFFDYVDVEGKFIDQGILRISIPASALGSSNSANFTLPNSIQVSNTTYDITGEPLTFTAIKSSMKYKRTWDIFAGGSAGVTGSVGSIGAGATVAMAKISVKGNAGVGLRIETDENNNIILDRRMEAGIGIEAKVPAVNTVVDVADFSVAKANVTAKTLLGQRFCFSDLPLDEEKKKIAQTGFLLETLSLGGVGLSPTAGIIIQAVINTLNTLGGVNETFESAKLEEYAGLGIEGSASLGINMKLGPISLSAVSESRSLAIMGKLKSISRQLNNNTLPNPFFSTEIINASNYNISLLILGGYRSDDVSLSSDNFSLFDLGIGQEISLYSMFDAANNPSLLSFSIKGGANVSIFSNDWKLYNVTDFRIPVEYLDIIKNGLSNISGIIGSTKNIDLNPINMAQDALGAVDDVCNQLDSVPIKITTSEIRGQSADLGLGIELEGALGVGAGLTLGVNGKYFDEISYPRKESELYGIGNNYLISSSEFEPQMADKDLTNIMKELLSGTIPLLKSAIYNLLKTDEQIVVAGKTYTISITSDAGNTIGELFGNAQVAGKWIITTFNPESPRTLQKSFQLPTVANIYYCTDIYHKKSLKNNYSILENSTSIMTVLGNAVNIGFKSDIGNNIDSIDSPVQLKMIISDNELLKRNFELSDKGKVKLYRYDKNLLGWIQEESTIVGDTVIAQITKMGSFALGIESDSFEDLTPPEIYEYGPTDNTTVNTYPEIFAKVRDNKNGSGIDLSKTIIILNNDTLNISYNPSEEKIFYKFSTLNNFPPGKCSVKIFVSDNNRNVTTKEFEFISEITNVEKKNILNEFYVYQNYPNPFNPETIIKFNLPTEQKVELIIFDVAGRYVSTLSNCLLPAGIHVFVWNGTDNAGEKLSSGIYFYQIKTELKNIVNKMILLK